MIIKLQNILTYLIPLLVAFITVYFSSLSIYPKKATNSLTTFYGPLYTNSQMEFASNTSNSSQSKLVNDSSLVTYNDTIKNLISTEEQKGFWINCFLKAVQLYLQGRSLFVSHLTSNYLVYFLALLMKQNMSNQGCFSSTKLQLL